MRLVIIASLVLVVVGCTHTQQTVTGAAAGGVTGAVVAGPLEQRWALVQGRWQHPSWQIDNE